MPQWIARTKLNAPASLSLCAVLLALLCIWPAWLSLAQAITDEAYTEQGIALSDVKQGRLLLKTDQTGRYIPAPTLKTDVQITITGLIARATVRQEFTNPSKDWAEGIYVFPLPETAAVDHLRMIVGDRVIEGMIKERAEAKKTYEQAKTEGKRASLVEQERPNIFTTSVANIGPGDHVTIEIEYQEAVRYDQGQFSLRFPMVIGHRYVPGQPTTNLVLDPPQGHGLVADTQTRYRTLHALHRLSSIPIRGCSIQSLSRLVSHQAFRRPTWNRCPIRSRFRLPQMDATASRCKKALSLPIETFS